MLPSRDCQGLPRLHIQSPVLRQEMWARVHFFSLIRNIHPAHQRFVVVQEPGCEVQVSVLEQAHTPGGQERSSAAEARERLGAQGPGQEVRRRRFAETWEIGPLCKANSQSEPPTPSSHRYSIYCYLPSSSANPLTISVSCCGCVFDPSADPRCAVV